MGSKDEVTHDGARSGCGEDVRGVMPGNQASYVLLSSGSKVTTLSGQAACVPGDAYDELQRVKKELGQ
jgi:hypothetical protein